MIDLYTIFTNFPELKREIFSWFDKYDDTFQISIFRQLDRSFYYLPLYEKLVIYKQPISFLKKFLTINKVRKLHIINNNSKLYKLPIKLFSSLEKITIDSLDEREFYFFCKYFSVLPIINLKINYCTCKFSDNLLQFNKLKTLDIHITRKDNEDLIFNFLKTNKDTLRKLKIGVYTGRNINEQLMAKIIKENLSLDFIDLRGDLFSYDMINPRTKIIRARFTYDRNHVNDLRYILSLRMYDIKNSDLPIIFNTLEVVQWVSLSGLSSNIESIQYSDDYKYSRIIWKPSQYEPDTYQPYDNTSCDIIVKSRNLNSFYLTTFTINSFELSNPNKLNRIYLSDVNFLKPISFPRVTEVDIDNFIMNPEIFNINMFKLPKVKNLNIFCCLITTQFVFKTIKSLNIQNCIINIDILNTLKQHKNIKSILFYHNNWSVSYNKIQIEKYLHSKRIDYYDSKDW